MRSKLSRPWYLTVFPDPGSIRVKPLLLESDNFVKSIKHSFWEKAKHYIFKGIYFGTTATCKK
jgi:hypothetical protein